jgi:hypothetical protein
VSRRTTIRIPDETYAGLVAQAKRERRTVSNLVNAILADALVVRSSVRSEAQLPAENVREVRGSAEK